MKIKYLMAAVTILTMATEINADVLSFDDVTTSTIGDSIPSGYGGFDWSNMSVLHKDLHAGSGYENGTVSGDYVAFNNDGTAASVSDGNFSFTGAYLTAAWNTGLSVNLKGYSSGSLIYDQTVVVDTDAPTWFNFNFNNIDNLVFESFGGVGGAGHFVMDDFTYVIPEPASLGLIGLVTGGLFFTRRVFTV